MHGTFFPLTVVYSPLSADHFHVYILPSSCITRWPHLRYCAALSKFVQFVKDRVQLLESSPASCQALRNQHEEKREKFILTNCLLLVLTHAGTVLNFEKPARAYFFMSE